MMVIDIVSHALGAFDLHRPHCLEVMPGGSVVFRDCPQGRAITAASAGGQPIERNGRDFTFTPGTPGRHDIRVTFEGGKAYSLNVHAFGEQWLARMSFPRSQVSNRASFDAKARLVLRSLAMAGNLSADGSFPADLNLAMYGAASSAGIHRRELAQ